MKDIFKGFETKKFPAELCTIQNEREPDVWDSSVPFVCVIVDERFESDCRVAIAKPYLAKDIGSDDMLPGWVSIQFDDWTDHRNDPIHGDYMRVVAWKRLEDPNLNFLKVFGLENGWES